MPARRTTVSPLGRPRSAGPRSAVAASHRFGRHERPWIGGKELAVGDHSHLDRARPPVHLLVVITVVVLVLVTVGLGLGRLDVSSRQLLTADDYMRFARVMDLLEGRTGWFDDALTWSNTPFGTTMHWTRPLDGIVATLSLPFRPFMAPVDAVYWGSLVSAPLLLLAAVAAVGWAARGIVPLPAAVLAAFVAGLQPAVTADSMVGRVDHHVLLLGTFALLLGVAVRLVGGVTSPPTRALVVAGGLVAAAGVWVSGEALIGVAFLLATLGLDWLARGGRGARHLAELASWWAAGSLVAVALERGPGELLVREYDRMSFAHVALAIGAAIASWSVVLVEWSLGPLRTLLSRCVVAGAAVVVGFVVTLALDVNPVDLLGAPYSLIPSDVRSFWLTELVEFQSARSAALAAVVLFYLVPLVGVALALCLARRESDRARRRSWVVVAGWLVASLVLAVTAIRLVVYPEVVAAVPVAVVAWRVMEGVESRHRVRSAMARAGIVVVALVGVYLPTAAVAAFSPDDDEAPAACEVDSLMDEISVRRARLDDPTGRPVAVLTQLDLGNLLHHRTGVDVVGTGHHRNVEGIRAVRDTFRAPPDVARREIERRGIDLVFICDGIGPEFMEPIPAGSLYDLLEQNRPPGWLRQVPAGDSGSRLYEVVET